MTQHYQYDVVIVGGGLAGMVMALELLDQNKRVLILDRDEACNFGGLAKQAFGGMALCGTWIQRVNGVKDNPDVMLKDWLSFAGFSEQDVWPKRWAQMYCQRNHDDVFLWLCKQGVRFFPAVNWAERGDFKAGNSVPRYHLIWGTGQRLVQLLADRLGCHTNAKKLDIKFCHRVDDVQVEAGQLVGVHGVNESNNERFTCRADITVVATGGMNGNLEKVRQSWPAQWGNAPLTLLNGSHQYSDGAMHDCVESIGGNVTHLDWQWNYAAGIHHPNPRMPMHGLSLIPPKSALWMDASGRRIGPQPLVTGYDTHGLCQRISQLPMGYSWQIMNRKIVLKELSISGSEHNTACRDRKLFRFVKEIVLGNTPLYDYITQQCPDVVVANSLAELGEKMSALNDGLDIDIPGMISDVEEYDAVIARGKAFYNDDQLRRIEQARRWKSDRFRTLKFQKITDPKAGPFVAIREYIISRKSMGGIQTDDHSRVLNHSGDVIPNLYAIGEAAGFGGGGANGNRSLEGTFLSLCVLTARVAARSIT